jgi:butyryl-CoA dehydrogenase
MSLQAGVRQLKTMLASLRRVGNPAVLRNGAASFSSAADIVKSALGSGEPTPQQAALAEVFSALDKFSRASAEGGSDVPAANPSDLLCGKLPEHLQIVKDQTRAWVEKNLKPVAAELDDKREFPRKLIREMGRQGLMGCAFPSKWDGAGIGYLGYVVALEEVARGCAGTGCCMSVHSSLYAGPVYTYGTDEQKEEFLKPFARGEKLGAFALTEPGAGSDAGAMVTRAHDDGDSWVINGNKQFITNSPESDAMVVFASVDTYKNVRKGITAFIVPNDTPGVQVVARERTMGLRACTFGRLVFENVRIPKSYQLGKEGRGFQIAMETLDGGRFGIAAQAVGIAQASLELACKYASERVQFGAPIANMQVIQQKIAEMAGRVEAARLLTWRAAAMKDAGIPYSKEAAMAKWTASETATAAAHQCIQILGGHGYTQDWPAERHYRDARITEIYEGTNEICRFVASLAEIARYKA